MNKSSNDLSALWQAQPVKSIDVEEVKRAFFAERKKQRMFIALDFLGIVPAIVLIWLEWASLSLLAGGMILGLIILCFPMLFYQLWLRRITAFGGDLKTRGYLESLIKQMENNSKIAWMTKHSCWITLVFIIVFYSVLYIQGEVATTDQHVKASVSIGVSSVILFFVYLWANRRQKLALERLSRFKAMQV